MIVVEKPLIAGGRGGEILPCPHYTNKKKENNSIMIKVQAACPPGRAIGAPFASHFLDFTQKYLIIPD